MSASRGVVDEIGPKSVAMKIRETDSSTPRSAVSRGMPAAMNEPNVRMSTTRATPTPMSSVALMVGRLCENTCPPTATWEPAGRAA